MAAALTAPFAVAARRPGHRRGGQAALAERRRCARRGHSACPPAPAWCGRSRSAEVAIGGCGARAPVAVARPAPCAGLYAVSAGALAACSPGGERHAGASARATRPRPCCSRCSAARCALVAVAGGCRGRARDSAGCSSAARRTAPVSDCGHGGAVYATVLAYTELPQAWASLERGGERVERAARRRGGRAAGAAHLAPRAPGPGGGGRVGVRGGAGALSGPARHGVGGDQAGRMRRRGCATTATRRSAARSSAAATPARPSTYVAGWWKCTDYRARGLCHDAGLPLLPRLQPRSPATVSPAAASAPSGDCGNRRGRLQPLPLRPVQHPGRRDDRGRVPAGDLPAPRRPCPG